MIHYRIWLALSAMETGAAIDAARTSRPWLLFALLAVFYAVLTVLRYLTVNRGSYHGRPD